MTVQEATNAFTQAAKDFSTVALRLSDIGGLQFFSEEPTEPEVTEPTDPEVTEPEKEEPKEKTFSQAEVNALLAKREKRARQKGAEEATKEFERKGMTEVERLQAELDDANEKLNKTEDEKVQAALHKQATQTLTDNNLNPAYAEFLVGSNEEETKEKFEAFKKIIDGDIERIIKSRIASKTPERAREPQQVPEKDTLAVAFEKGLM